MAGRMRPFDLLGASACALVWQAAAAGTAADQAAADQSDSAVSQTTSLDEIVVTAQRRSENLERVPVAITVVSGDALLKQNINTETDLPFASPGLLVRTGATSNEVNYSLRGQSLDAYSGAVPGVLPYFNEVQLSTNSGGGSGSTAFYDLQSVQVLKGPQGTLFGRNATGGAVLFTTTKPTEDFGGYVNASQGNYATTQVQAALNAPLLPGVLLGRIAGFFQHQEGYQTNLYDGSHPGTGDRQALRASLTFKPVDGLSNDLVVDWYKIYGTSTQSVTYNLQNIPGATPAPFLYSPAGNVALPGVFAAYLTTHTNPTINPNGLAAFVAQQNARGPFTIATNDLSEFQGLNLVVTNTTTYALGADTQLKNIFGYGRLQSFTQGDSDGSPFGIAGDSARTPLPPGYTTPFGANAISSIYSEELQLSGKTMNQHLTYATGLYYEQVNANYRVQSDFFDLFGGVPSINDDVKKNTVAAVYGQGTYDLADLTRVQGLGFTLGLRYNDEDAKRMLLPDDQTYSLEAQFPGIYDNDQHKRTGNVSWTDGLQEQLTPDLLLYIVNRRSYRDAGFNSSVVPKIGFADTGGAAYKTETATDVEVGAKFQGSVMGVPTRANVDVYHNWIQDSQRAAFVSVNGNPSAITVNVPKQLDLGAELDGQIQPVSYLNIGGSLSYINARFTEQQVVAFGVTQDFATVPDTPRWSGTVYAEVTVPVSGSIAASLRGDGFSQSGTAYSSTANLNPGARLPEYTVADARLGLEDTKAGWLISANVKNLANRTYYVGGIALAPLLDYNTALPGLPRTYSVNVRYKF